MCIRDSTCSVEINDDDLLMEKFASISQIIKTMTKYEEGASNNEV